MGAYAAMVPGRRPLGVVAALLSALLLVGCGSGTGSSDGGRSSGTAPADSGSSSSGVAVAVVEKEFSIELSKTRLNPGTYTFKVENRGQAPHNLIIEGPGVDATSSSTLQGGESDELTVTLAKGSYEVWCGIGSHRAQGMATTVQVG